MKNTKNIIVETKSVENALKEFAEVFRKSKKRGKSYLKKGTRW